MITWICGLTIERKDEKYIAQRIIGIGIKQGWNKRWNMMVTGHKPPRT